MYICLKSSRCSRWSTLTRVTVATLRWIRIDPGSNLAWFLKVNWPQSTSHNSILSWVWTTTMAPVDPHLHQRASPPHLPPPALCMRTMQMMLSRWERELYPFYDLMNIKAYLPHTHTRSGTILCTVAKYCVFKGMSHCWPFSKLFCHVSLNTDLLRHWSASSLFFTAQIQHIFSKTPHQYWSSW